jgi:rhodanese-related sulfurtransferase
VFIASPALAQNQPAAQNSIKADTQSLEDFSYILPKELMKLLRKTRDIVLIDTRSPAEFKSEHIRGAINVPWTMELIDTKNVPKNKTIVIYCDCTSEETSKEMALQLIDLFGYDKSKTLILLGGFAGWKELGYPLSKAKTRKR